LKTCLEKMAIPENAVVLSIARRPWEFWRSTALRRRGLITVVQPAD